MAVLPILRLESTYPCLMAVQMMEMVCNVLPSPMSSAKILPK